MNGKSYNHEGNGEFKIRNGNVIAYDFDGKLFFECECLNGEKWNRKRKIYKDNGILIEVELLNGKINEQEIM